MARCLGQAGVIHYGDEISYLLEFHLIQGSGWQGRPAYMPKALSFDLRSRVLAAIDEGLSCRQAATRFGVSASSASRWQAMRREAMPGPSRRAAIVSCVEPR